MWDEEVGLFRMWYQSVAPGEGDAVTRYACYGESDDGVTWRRPQLGLVEFRGSKANNIVREMSDADGFLWNIVRDAEEPDPARRYKAVGFDYCAESAVAGVKPGTMGICVGYSPDGLRWTDPKLVLPTEDVTDADCILPVRDPATGLWAGFFRPRTHPKRRFIGISTSDDFDTWTYPRMLLMPGDGDDEWSEFYGLTAALVGRWRVGCLWVYHNNPEFSPMTNELVYSRDGAHYHRAAPGVPFLPLGDDSSADSRMIRPFAMISHGDEVLLYYQGTNREHGSDRGMPMQTGRIDGTQVRSHLGVARLPMGHFCGLRADVDGLVETDWITLYGAGGIRAAADIRPGGALTCEILDQYGSVIPSFGRGECSMAADGAAVRFSWKSGDGSALGGVPGEESAAGGRIGHVVRLRFHLRRATLCGFAAGDKGATPARS